MGVRDTITHARGRNPGAGLGPSAVLVSVALALAAAALWSLFLPPPVTGDGETVRVALAFDRASAVMLAGFAVSLGYAGYWLADAPASTRGRWTAVAWTGGGMVVLSGLALLLQRPWTVTGASRLAEPVVQEFVLAAGGGAIAGVLVGIATIQRDHSLEQLQRQRDAQEHMNALLRHNVLNAMQIVLAAAEDLDDDSADRIRHHGESVVAFVDDVRAVSRSLSEETDLRPVDVDRVLADLVADVREAYPEATFEVEVATGATVEADDRLSLAVRQLLENAVVHHDGTPTVGVRATAAGDSVVVTVTDDGPGLPVEHRGSHGPSNPRPVGADGGLGLYLSDALVERYGGSLELDVRRAGGTVARVRLPRAD